MTEIEYYFKRIIIKQKEIGHRMYKYLRKGLSTVEINKFEKELGHTLPDDYKNYFEITDGVDIFDGIFDWDMEILPGDFSLTSSKSVLEMKKDDDFYDLLENYEINYLTKYHIPVIKESSSNCFWINLDTKDSYFGYILEWSHGSMPNYIFKDLTRFFEAICVAYETDVIKKDKENRLTMDYYKFEAIQKKISENLDWTDR